MRGLVQLFSLVLLLISSYANSQSLNNYTTTRTTSITYSSISTSGNAISNWRNTVGLTQDDNRSFPTSIGFDFWYNGTRYTDFSVSTNGFIDFSTSTADGTGGFEYSYDNTEFTANGSGTWLAIAPFYDDMTAAGGIDPLGSSIKYLVSGTAPNRVLTIEWIDMAVYLDVTPSLNFQVKLYETSGVIEFVYGTMNAGSHNFSYTCGINSATLNNNPTVAQLKAQQTANSNTFNNGQQNGLVAVPISNSKITFTPPTPAPVPSGALTFSAVTALGMTLNWTNWCTNEVGYVIYNSLDNLNFDFVNQTNANATNISVTGLLPSTLYYWRVYSVTDGALSTTFVTSFRTTLSGINKVSNNSGNWNTAGIWTPNGVPTAADNVTIANGTTVTINADAVCNNLTVGQGTSGILRIGNNNTSRIVDVNNNITINSGGNFQANTASNTTHTLNLKGNITNNGILNFASDANSFCDVNFIKNGNQQISGTGATNNFNLLTLSMGNSINNTLDITSSNFSATNNFLTLNTGTFKLSTTNTLAVTPYTGTATIPNSTAINVNSATATVNFLNGINLFGNLVVNSGTVNIGNAADENLSSSGGNFQILGGSVRLAGRYFSADINNLANFLISGGTLTLPISGSTSTTVAPFQINGVGSSFNMSGGSIVIEREGGTGAQDLGYAVTGITGGSITGGTLQIGNGTTPAAQVISINTSSPIGNLLLNSTNVTARLNSNSLTVFNDVTINSGTLNSNNLNITLNGNWLNTSGTHIPGTGTVYFTGTNQSITKTLGESFNNIALSGGGTKTLGGAINCNGNILLDNNTTLDVTASNHGISLNQNWTNNGIFAQHNGNVTFNGTIAQSIGGSSLTNFYNITSSNGAGVNIATPQNLINTLTITTGTFATNNIAFTLLSNATNTANIAAIPTGANITGNIIMQRFAPGGKTGWAMLGSPVLGQTLANWKDDFAMSGFAGSNQPSNPFKSVYTYNESTLGTYTLGYVAATSTANPIVSGVGYTAYVGTAFTNTADINIDMIGVPFVGPFTYTVNYTASSGGVNNDGWNLLANPYPSALDWESASWTRANLNNTIYSYNADIGQYVTYSLGGLQTNGGVRYIPSSQAFWIKATGTSPVLRSVENVKSNAQPTFLKQAQSIYSIESINIKITNQTFTDETTIGFKSDATKGFDDVYDAFKFQTNLVGAPTIASQIASDIFAVNVRPKINQLDTVEIKVLVPTTTVYTLTIPKTVLNDSLYCLLLKDKHTNTIMPVDTSLSYVFTATDTTKFSRFQLFVQKPYSIGVTEPSCSNLNQAVSLSSSLIGVYSYTITNSLGNQILAAEASSTTNLSSLTSDSYNVVFTNQNALCPSLSDTIFIHNYTIAESAAAIAITDLNLLATNNSTNAVSYNWDFGDTQTSQLPEPSHQYQNIGTYTVTLEAISIDGCSSISTYSVVASEPVTTITTPTVLENNELSQLQLIVKDDQVELSVIGNEIFAHLTAEIIDITGKTIKRNVISQLKQGENQYINLLDLPASVYLVRVYNNAILKQIKIATIK